VLTGPDVTACRLESDLSPVQVRFQYDAQHRRIARQDGSGAWKQYVMAADGSPLSELTRPITAGGAWAPVRDYVWLDGKPLVQLEYPGPQVYALHTDHLGLPRAMTSSSGATIWSGATRPYGDLVETTSTGVVTNLRLPGQYHERGTSPTDAGLLSSIGIQGPFYNWNRWYLPMAGRYLELDPIALRGSFNSPYGPDWNSYAGGGPLARIDSTGEFDNGSCPGCSDTCCCEAVKFGPSACPGAAPPGPKPRPAPICPVPLPDPKPDPNSPNEKCWDEYIKCVSGPIGGRMSGQYGYSQCQICQEVCVQEGGIWPVVDRNGRPCQ
jgi:RHS repeat-associated protein